MKKNKTSINKKAWEANKPSKNVRIQLENIRFDESMKRINDKLSDIKGMTPVTYESIESKLAEANANLEDLCYYIDESINDIKKLIDEPFFQSFDSKNGVLEAFERIKLDDYQVKNELGIKEYGTNKIYHHPTGTFEDQDYAFEKDTIGIQDIINNMDIKGTEGAPSFAEMMRHNFETCEDLEGQDFDEYVETLVHRSDITHTVDRGWLNFLSDTLDTIGIVSAVAIFTGTDFVTGEILTDEERENALLDTAVNVGFLLLTIATSGVGASLALGTKTAIKQTACYVVKASAADMVTGLAGLATMNVLDLIGTPKELSMFLGLAASFVAGNKINSKIDTGNGASNISTTEDILDEASEIKKFDLSEENEIALEMLDDTDSSVIKGASGAKMPEITTNFNYKTKYDEVEFTTQLKNQEKGLNELTISEFVENRKNFKERGRSKEASKLQKELRESFLENKIIELRSAGMSRSEAKKEAKKWMKTQAVLHDPDQIVGGNPMNLTGLGDKNINSSIGSQWRYRIDDLEKQIMDFANTIPQSEWDNVKLNIKLTY